MLQPARRYGLQPIAPAGDGDAPVLGDAGSPRGDPGAVDQPVDGPLVLFQFIQQAGGLQWFSQVADAEQDLHGKALTQLAGNAVQRIALLRDQDQAAPARCQGFGQGSADTAGGAGSQGITGRGVRAGLASVVMRRESEARAVQIILVGGQGDGGQDAEYRDQ